MINRNNIWAVTYINQDMGMLNHFVVWTMSLLISVLRRANAVVLVVSLSTIVAVWPCLMSVFSVGGWHTTMALLWVSGQLLAVRGCFFFAYLEACPAPSLVSWPSLLPLLEAFYLFFNTETTVTSFPSFLKKNNVHPGKCTSIQLGDSLYTLWCLYICVTTTQVKTGGTPHYGSFGAMASPK